MNTGNEYPDIIRFVRHLRDDRGYNIEEIHPKAKPREVWSRYGFPLVSKAQAQSVHEYQHARDKEKLLARLRDSREKDGSVMKGYIIAQKHDGLWCSVSYGPHLDVTMRVYRAKVHARLRQKLAGYRYRRRRLI